MTSRLSRFLLLVIFLSVSTAYSQETTLKGAGGTAIFPLLSKWSEAYKQKAGVVIDYQAVGSGAGIAQIKAKSVIFANSDKPLKPEELKEAGLLQFPAVVIGITPVINVPGVKPGNLIFDGQVLADIFLGKITKWNDKAIQALNPDLTLPDLAIIVVHRSDGSGTTFNFADYLCKVSSEWKAKIGTPDTTISWPTGIAAKGSDGVADQVQKNPGSVAYVEYAYAMQRRIDFVRMKNHDGKIVNPYVGTFQAAAANADFAAVPDFYLILTDQSGMNSWPITAATYILLRRDSDKEVNTSVVKFIAWCMTEGQAQAKELNYVPLPERTFRWIKAYWKSQVGVDL